MLVDYDEFRKKDWDERVRVFGAISSEEKAELVRTHIARWLASHRQELDPSQIEILEENVAFVSAALYVRPLDGRLLDRSRELEGRTARVLSRDQMREALTMHWDVQ
jgi:hypothetical protein